MQGWLLGTHFVHRPLRELGASSQQCFPAGQSTGRGHCGRHWSHRPVVELIRQHSWPPAQFDGKSAKTLKVADAITKRSSPKMISVRSPSCALASMEKSTLNSLTPGWGMAWRSEMPSLGSIATLLELICDKSMPLGEVTVSVTDSGRVIFVGLTAIVPCRGC